MAYEALCKRAELEEGDSATFFIGTREVLLLWPAGDRPRAFQGTCPHQEISLAHAIFDGATVLCQAHKWRFDGKTGKSFAPQFCKLKQYALQVDDGMISVDIETAI